MTASFDDLEEYERELTGAIIKPKLAGGTDAPRAESLLTQPDEIPYNYGEDRCTELFVQRHAHELKYVTAWGRWYEWNGSVWHSDEIARSLNKIKKTCRVMATYALQDQDITPAMRSKIAANYSNSRTVGGVERLAKCHETLAATTAEWDRDEWLLNTPTGVVDLRTGTLSICDPKHRMTQICAVGPTDAQDCPTWLALLRAWTGGDKELEGALRRIAGYCLTGCTREQCLFFFYGTGGNGKGTFINTILFILAMYARTAPAEVFTEQQGNRHSTEIARFMGARLVASQETEQGKRWAESRIKSLTGGDPITARFMRQDDFTFMPQFKIIMSGNHKPRLRNVDEAIKRRMNILPFTVSFKKDESIPEKLKKEYSGILRWMIDGCMEWQKIGLAMPKSVRDATASYLSEQDPLLEWLESMCIQEKGVEQHSTEFYKSYRSFTENTGEYVMQIRDWREKLLSRGLNEQFRHGGIKYFQNVRLKSSIPESF